jgi:hypothetical protein
MSEKLIFCFVFALVSFISYKTIKPVKEKLKNENWETYYIKMRMIKIWISVIGFGILSLISFLLWLIEE